MDSTLIYLKADDKPLPKKKYTVKNKGGDHTCFYPAMTHLEEI